MNRQLIETAVTIFVFTLGNGVAAWLGAKESPVIGAVVIGILTFSESIVAVKKIREAQGMEKGKEGVLWS